MQFILHNDDTIHGFDEAQEFAREVVSKALKGREDRLSRIEIWIADENAGKSGPDDKKCTIEAHPRGTKPVTVHANADAVIPAIRAAASKLAHALEHRLHKS